MSTEHPAVRIQRTIAASPDRVYRAWLEPELLTRWMHPGDFTVSRAEVDERVGGRYRIWHRINGEDAGGFECELLELVPGERIVARWGFVGPDRTAGPVYDSLLTIMLREIGEDTTELTLLHEHLGTLHAGLPDAAEQVQPGWEAVLTKLASLLNQGM